MSWRWEENSIGMVQGGTACRECEVCPVFFPGAGAFLSAMRVRVTGGGTHEGVMDWSAAKLVKARKQTNIETTQWICAYDIYIDIID